MPVAAPNADTKNNAIITVPDTRGLAELFDFLAPFLPDNRTQISDLVGLYLTDSDTLRTISITLQYKKFTCTLVIVSIITCIDALQMLCKGGTIRAFRNPITCPVKPTFFHKGDTSGLPAFPSVFSAHARRLQRHAKDVIRLLRIMIDTDFQNVHDEKTTVAMAGGTSAHEIKKKRTYDIIQPVLKFPEVIAQIIADYATYTVVDERCNQCHSGHAKTLAYVNDIGHPGAYWCIECTIAVIV
jgi:hypothetical protein